MTPAAAQRRRRRAIGGAVAFVLLSVAAAPPAFASITPPAAAHSIETEPVRHNASDADVQPRSGSAVLPAAQGAADIIHVVLALSVVVGLIFGLRWTARKMALVPDAGRGGRTVQVLNRTPIAAKQQIVLLKVGNRVLVVADSGAAGMQMLTQFTDADEVAALIGEVRSAPATPAASGRSFAAMFGRAAEPFAARQSSTAPSEPPMPGEVAGLLDKVRGLRQRFEA